MFDIGWTELMLIGIVALIVIGPKDLPNMFRTLGQFVGKARRMAREFQRSMEDAADEAGISEATRSISNLKKADPLGLNAIKDSNKKYTESILATREAKIAEKAEKEATAATPAAAGNAATSAPKVKEPAAQPAPETPAPKTPAPKKPAPKKPAAKKAPAKTAAKTAPKTVAKKPAAKAAAKTATKPKTAKPKAATAPVARGEDA
ncbi:Sec-independent protein translocase protein TatB [Abyssibius alkaniclasticus]|uniref:Sec-independent protein translocase protein TatB n=1 Tax=Abyssibius alkaniclasticus TaxID=2881234 RepID=UPI002363593B|nr:Sec-independent protein translocase protein TatB [Abyssibius alkaniclasticus]UPH70571.1 Sec-independent protein translocase protein TatB [Abyssibius alkaniclasticus]